MEALRLVRRPSANAAIRVREMGTPLFFVTAFRNLQEPLLIPHRNLSRR